MNSPFSPVFAKENPFLAPAVAPVFEPAAEADAALAHTVGDEKACYALIGSGPPVAPSEVETAATAIEVTVRWGAQVLLVKHLGPGKAFRLGDDFVLPEDVASGASDLVVRRAEGPVVVVPSGARAVVSSRGEATARELAGGEEVLLTEASRVVIEAFATREDGSYGEPIVFEIAAVRAGKVTKVGFMTALAGSAIGFVGASFLGHAAIVASLAMFMPKMGADDSEAIDRDQMMLMQKLLTASAEREHEETKPENAGADASQGGGGGGERHMGEEGKAGKMAPVNTSGRMASKGKEAESKLSRAQEIEFAQTQGLVGMLLATTTNTDPNAPHSPWSTDTYQGSDDRSAQGDMFSQNIDDAAGMGGLGLNGTGEGGGGKGAGVGLDTTGGIGGGGHGKGFGLGPGEGGFGIGRGKGGGGHKPKALSMRTPSDPLVNGRLPPEVIQRIVRQNFGKLRFCYEEGLRGNPSLQGRVVTKFMIGRDGSVNTSSDAGSDLPDQKVTQCIVRTFMSLSFPQPEGGVATVVYPLTLSPGE